MNSTWSEQIGNEVYIYVLGRLVMKRWIRNKVSALFQVNPLWTYYI